jgi:hypothetical protein
MIKSWTHPWFQRPKLCTMEFPLGFLWELNGWCNGGINPIYPSDPYIANRPYETLRLYEHVSKQTCNKSYNGTFGSRHFIYFLTYGTLHYYSVLSDHLFALRRFKMHCFKLDPEDQKATGACILKMMGSPERVASGSSCRLESQLPVPVLAVLDTKSW